VDEDTALLVEGEEDDMETALIRELWRFCTTNACVPLRVRKAAVATDANFIL
jgi:hypothetical protein